MELPQHQIKVSVVEELSKLRVSRTQPSPNFARDVVAHYARQCTQLTQEHEHCLVKDVLLTNADKFRDINQQTQHKMGAHGTCVCMCVCMRVYLSSVRVRVAQAGLIG